MDGKQDGGAGHGDGIRHRLGGVNRHGLIRQQPGHQIDQGQQQDEFPQHCHNDGAAGGTNGNEGHLTGDLDTKEEQRPAIDPQGGHRKGHQRHVRGEDPGKRSGAQLDHRPQRHRIAQTHLQQQPEGLPHPLGIPCAVIVAGDGPVADDTLRKANMNDVVITATTESAFSVIGKLYELGVGKEA